MSESFNINSVFDFVERLALVAPFFIDERAAIQAESALWYARAVVESKDRRQRPGPLDFTGDQQYVLASVSAPDTFLCARGHQDDSRESAEPP
jgi:hypothetical protein